MATNQPFKIRRVHHIALLGMLTTLCYVSRLVFQFLPNVQPVTVILLLITILLGAKDGLIVSILSVLISNINLGLGVWTFAQIASFSAIILLTGAINRYVLLERLPFLAMVAYAGLTGYLYGFIISAVQAPFFGIQNFWAYYLSGVPFDTLHAVGNSGFYVILAPILIPLIKKLMKNFYA